MEEMTEYAKLHIEFTAPESKINDSVSEMELSEEVDVILYDLREWLGRRLAGTLLGFSLTETHGEANEC